MVGTPPANAVPTVAPWPSIGRTRRHAIPAVLFVFALACRLLDLGAESICYDELVAKDSGPRWNLLCRGDFSSKDWAYGKQMTAIPLWVFGVIPEAVFGDNPSDPYQLNGARVVAALLGSALVVMVYWFGREIGGDGIGVAAALLFSLYPAVLGHDRIVSHDLPARIASVAAVWLMARHTKSGHRTTWLWSALWAGCSLASYVRVGVQTVAVLVAFLAARWFVRGQDRALRSLQPIMTFGAVAVGVAVVVFIATWPYAWSRPIEGFREWLEIPLKNAQLGGTPQWILGEIRPAPLWYYPAVYVFMCPTLLLAAHLYGCRITWPEVRRVDAVALAWLVAAVPMVVGGSFRSSLNHYLLVCFPGTCVLAALGIRAVAEQLTAWRGYRLAWFPALTAIVLCSTAVTAVRIHPYHLDFFNILVGGTRTVARHRLLSTGWYGEGTKALFAHVNAAADAGDSVNCRLGPWPGIVDLQRNLRKDMEVHGARRADPLGAHWVIRVGLETYNEMYRFDPDPDRYEKVHDVLALGGSIGDVWKRRDIPPESGLVYADDFASSQPLHYATGALNMGFNPFTDGRFYPEDSSRPAGVLFRIPANLLGETKTIQVRARARCANGVALVQGGAGADSRKELARQAFFDGWLDSGRIDRPGTGDLWVSLEMETTIRWDGRRESFWNHDCFDALEVSAWP